MAVHEPAYEGIYGIPEAALYLRSSPPFQNGHAVTLPTARLRYWIRTGVSPITPIGLPSNRLFISFRDLITMRLVAVLRFRGLGMEDIRRTERNMRAIFQVEWPFVWRPLWTYGSRPFTELGTKLLEVSNGQLAMDFLREWLRHVELDMSFDDQDLVASWSPSPGVRINPKIRLGDPCIDGSRIPTKTIWGKIKAGDSIEVVSSLYGLSETQIDYAITWEQRLLAAKS